MGRLEQLCKSKNGLFQRQEYGVNYCILNRKNYLNHNDWYMCSSTDKNSLMEINKELKYICRYIRKRK